MRYRQILGLLPVVHVLRAVSAAFSLECLGLGEAWAKHRKTVEKPAFPCAPQSLPAAVKLAKPLAPPGQGLDFRSETFPGQCGYYECVEFVPDPSDCPTYKPPKIVLRPMRNRKINRSRRLPRGRQAGFTLLELLLVLAILVVIGGIVTVNIGGAQTEAKINATKAQLSGLKNFIQLYQIRMNGIPETLEVLCDGPSDAAKKAKWVAPIITEIPTDAWENPLEYTVSGNTYEIRSSGADGQPNSEDDIIVAGP